MQLNSKNPRIGITTSYADSNLSLRIEYILAVRKYGGLPLIVPILSDIQTAREFSNLLDGLIITGGPGITEGLVGNLPDDLKPVEHLRYQSDIFIFQSMSSKPILGICYGMQFINAQRKGTIYADLNTINQDTISHTPSRGGEKHLVIFSEGSRLGNLLGSQCEVNTFHIQAIATIGEGLKVTGMSSDKIVESIESEDGLLTGTQFHPEKDLNNLGKVIEDFIERCRMSSQKGNLNPKFKLIQFNLS